MFKYRFNNLTSAGVSSWFIGTPSKVNLTVLLSIPYSYKEHTIIYTILMVYNTILILQNWITSNSSKTESHVKSKKYLADKLKTYLLLLYKIKFIQR